MKIKNQKPAYAILSVSWLDYALLFVTSILKQNQKQWHILKKKKSGRALVLQSMGRKRGAGEGKE